MANFNYSADFLNANQLQSSMGFNCQLSEDPTKIMGATNGQCDNFLQAIHKIKNIDGFAIICITSPPRPQ